MQVPRLRLPGAGNCLPLLDSTVGGAFETRIFLVLCMGPVKKPPFSWHRFVSSFDTFDIINRISQNKETFEFVSPFLVEKAITGSVGTLHQQIYCPQITFSLMLLLASKHNRLLNCSRFLP
ncbi:hypothetical protein AVEN_79922-1 [Araneus ventricosus]|uniref:Uncharacterized protein n=1 Tax=Araneus ventricosus TaxID=182803 RepID=A0A4Y2GJZ4_ARAVE|nr:hypothetical protein AVEN_79922-1 [Araneus ventricosus]